ncbi:MAG: zinc ribbon domain-containing protein [Candidatus Aminicenantes bacterium]|nr:MAG: zinc ribbon domain-containing protein [Candidatus Aminicenantes bacterium]
MPIYEYRCKDCSKKSTVVTLSVKSSVVPKCKKCGSSSLEKIVSRVAIFRSEESRLESLADPSKLAGLDENDPSSVARWMKKMGKEMGEDLGEDFDQTVEEAVEETERAKNGEGEGGAGGEDI